MLTGRRTVKPVRARHRAAKSGAVGLARVLPQIQSLIQGGSEK